QADAAASDKKADVAAAAMPSWTLGATRHMLELSRGPAARAQLGDMFRPTSTPHLDFTLFGGGFAAENFQIAEEGVQAEQSLTQRIGLVGRATGYQLFIQGNAISPLRPNEGHSAR